MLQQQKSWGFQSPKSNGLLPNLSEFDDGLKDWFEYQNNDYNSVDGDLVGLGLSDEQLNDYEEMDNDIMVSIGISPEEPTSKARTPKKRISFSVTIDGDFSDSIILKVQGNGQIKKEYV